MHRLFHFLLAATAAALLPCLSWAETVTIKPATIGVSFGTEANKMAAGGTDLYGFYDEAGGRGGLLAEGAWTNVNNASGTVELNDTANAIAYWMTYSGGTPWGPSSSSAGKLLASYLDNGANITIAGLPPSGYDVAIIFSGDGGKFSAVTVNGTDKTYNAAGELVNGSSAWGDRTHPSSETKTLSSTGTDTTGNVMFLAGMTSSTLTLRTTNNTTVSPHERGTIAAIQIYVKDGSCESIDLTDRGATTIKLSELTFTEGTNRELRLVLADGATLEVDGTPALGLLRVSSEGSVTVVGSEVSLAQVGTLETRNVTGTATLDYANATATPTLPLLSGVEALRKSGTEAWEPTSNMPFSGSQFIAAGGETTLNLNLSATVSTAEAPMTVTGSGSLLRLTGDQSRNRAPNKATLLAEEGATLALAGVNPFPNGEDAPSLYIDAATLRVECSSQSHIKVADVTLANDASVEIAGTEGAYVSEGLVINTPGALRVESGASTVAYAEGATENKLLIGTGAIEVAQGASLTLDVALGHDIVKQGAGELTIPAARMRATEVAAGTLAIAGLSGDFSHALSGTGTVRLVATGDTTLTGTVASTLSLACEGAHVFALGTSRPTIAAFTEGATLKLTVTEEERIAGKVRLPLGTGVTLAQSALTLVDGTGASLAVGTFTQGEDGTLDITLAAAIPQITATGAWGSVEAWSTGSVPTEGTVSLVGGETAEAAITVTLDTAIPAEITRVLVKGHVRLVASEAQATVPAGVELLEGAALTVSADFPAAFTVPAGTTLALDGAEVTKKITVNGTLTSTGNSALTNDANEFAGTVDVLAGTLRLNAGQQKLYGTLNVRAGATFVNLRSSDALRYGGTATVNVWGTVDMGATRWTIGGRNTMNLYAGAQVLGAGQGDNQGVSAWDWFEANTVHFPTDENRTGSVSIPAALRLRGVTVTFDIANSNLSVELSGKIIGTGSLTKAGSGNSRLRLSGENKEYTGTTTVSNGYLDLVGGTTLATSGLTAQGGTAITFQADEANSGSTYAAPITLTGSGRLDKFGDHTVTLSGVISGDGALNVKAGTLTLTAACTRNANALTTIEAGAALDLSASSARLYRTSFGGVQNGTTMTVRGRLVTRNWAYSENTETGNALGALRSNHYAVKLDGGTVQFVDTDGNGLGSRGFTVTANGATLEIPEGSTLELPKVEHAYANLNGNTLKVCGGGRLNVLQARGPNNNPTDLIGAVTVAEGTALSGTGTLSGTVTLEAGATLDATAGVLTVGTLALPEGEGVVTLKAAADAAKGAEVLRFSTPVDVMTFNEDAFTVQGTTLGVVPGSNGSALILTFVATFPDTMGVDNGELTDAVAVVLLTAAERLDVPNVAAVTGRTYGSDLTAAALSGALECFVGEGLVSKGEATAEGTPLTVAYDFGIAAITHNPDGSFTVTVRVQDAAGGDTVAFAPGTTVELYAPDAPDEALVEPKTIEGTPSTVTFEIPATTAAARFNVRPLPFKARVRKE